MIFAAFVSAIAWMMIHIFVKIANSGVIPQLIWFVEVRNEDTPLLYMLLLICVGASASVCVFFAGYIDILVITTFIQSASSPPR